ncbi:MAG: hypothetical protein U0350_40080 [Caldilineaceae bacterium]
MSNRIYSNRIEVTSHTNSDVWKLTHATNQEDGDWLRSCDYILSPAQAATLQATGAIVIGHETLISVEIDPVEGSHESDYF